MPPKKLLSEIKNAQIVALSGEGYSQVDIARKMECSRKRGSNNDEKVQGNKVFQKQKRTRP